MDPPQKNSFSTNDHVFFVLTFDSLTQILLSKSSPYVTATSLQNLENSVSGCMAVIERFNRRRDWGGGGVRCIAGSDGTD